MFRVLSMVHKNCAAGVPHPGAYSDADTEILDAAHCLIETVRPMMARQALSEALEVLWTVIRAANAYVDKQAPWALRKTDPERMATVLYVLAEVIRHLAVLAQPFMPESAFL